MKTRTLWKGIRESVAGSHQDYTQGPIGEAILLLAIPMVLETVMESIFAVVDIFFVSRLGAAAIATVGLTEAMLTILYALAMGLSMGAAAVVSRRTGEKNPDEAATSAVQAIIIGIFVSLIIGVIGVVFGRSLLTLMGGSPEVVRVGANYTRIMLGCNIVIVMLFLINAIFRGAGDAAIAMRVLWLANAINILLGPCFIFGLGPFPELGVTGAAVATSIGRGIGVVYQITRLVGKTRHIRIQRRNLRIDPETMMTIIKVSGTGIIQSLVHTTSWVALIRILSAFGSAAVAGYTVAIRIVVFAILPSWGMSNAAATMVGQNLGARQPERAEESVWITCRYNCVFLGIIGLLFFVFAGPLIALFTKEAEIAKHGISCLRIISAGFVFYAYGMVLTNSFNGAGDTKTPTIINLVCFWLWEIPLALVLSRYLKLGPNGVFIAVAVAFSTLAVISAVVFRKGNWKMQKV